MSSQTQLGEFEAARTADTQVQRRDDTEDSTQHTCDCGAAVTPHYARVMGDNSGQVHACPECSLQRERFEGATGGAGR
jgi:hypothetical protein